MGKHLRKFYSSDEVKDIFKRYSLKEIGIEQSLALLKIGRRQFFKLLKVYRENPDSFSLDYKRKGVAHHIDPKVEQKIINELKKDAEIIKDRNNPVKIYNYSYVKEVLEKKYKVRVSLPTIIARAKKMGFIRKRNLESHTTVRY